MPYCTRHHEEYVKAKTDAAMKKDFLHFVTQENPKSELAKLASKVWKSFKTWWERTKKPEVEKAAKESVLKKLQRSKQELNKIAARWPAKAVAQFFFS